MVNQENGVDLKSATQSMNEVVYRDLRLSDECGGQRSCSFYHEDGWL